ncbi:MAG: MFS transporter [Candidatus Binatia bacterium]
MMRLWANSVLLLIFPLTSVAWADGGHGHAFSENLPAPLWVWAVGFGGLALIAFLLIHQVRRGRLLGERFTGFSWNARLLLLRSPFSGLSVSLLRLLFNLYLLAVGFDTLFVAKFVALNWACHGLAVIPSGILSDLFGRRRVFLLAYSGNLLATAAVIFITDPTLLLVLAVLIGFFEGGHAIVGPPFMIEQSRGDERVHLFSLNGGIQVGAASLGNLAAGLLPLLFAGVLGVGPETAWARRGALMFALPTMLLSMIPIYLIREQWKPIDIRQWAKSIESYGRIGMLALTKGLAGLGMGCSAPFFNVFFDQNVRASTAQIGLIFALGSICTAIVMLFIPIAVRRIGRVRTIAFVKFLGVPALLLLGMSHSIIWAGLFYILTILFVGGPYPNRGISDPIFNLFSMEVVKERERGTTNGIMHAFVEFPMGIGAVIAGPYMTVGDWQTPYAIGAGAVTLAFALYYLYFVRIEEHQPVIQAVPTS